ncbi:hypothetical protein [Nocardia sp. R7R-8]|uniref:hypothetical protein n=1 Tax=Nocardia sp. R7R-8 TaxID=3459304 RepID=UPI00403E0E44
MSHPLPDGEGLPSWKLRLLERIQDTAADHTRVLRQGCPIYQPRYGSGDEVQLHTWRSHLRALEADRSEIELHAAAVGVPESAITAARVAGVRGLRWADSAHSPNTMRRGEDPVRAHMVEGIAADVWQLEHMAAISVEYRLRGLDDIGADDPGAREQFDRNMAAVWTRANETAHVVGLSAAERAQLWDRDSAGWLKLVSVTVRGYDDPALLERWRVYAWRGIEHDARRALDPLAGQAVTSPEPSGAPPAPQLLIDCAAEALSTTTPGQVAPEAGIDAVAAAAPDRDVGQRTGRRTRYPATGNRDVTRARPVRWARR